MTAKLAEKDSTITYEYDFERLSHIKYPFNTYNDVTYTYGETGDDYNRAGRIILQEDATGMQEFWYDEKNHKRAGLRSPCLYHRIHLRYLEPPYQYGIS